MSSEAARRLAAAVKARREELDLTQLEVWQNGGPSNTTLTVIENGLTENLTRTTRRKLDLGLRWEAGSAQRVWEGAGDPIPAGDRDLTLAHKVAAMERILEKLQSWDDLTLEQRRSMIASVRKDLDAMKALDEKRGAS